MNDPQYGERAPERKGNPEIMPTIREVSPVDLQVQHRSKRPISKSSEIFGVITGFAIVAVVLIPLGIFLTRLALGDL